MPQLPIFTEAQHANGHTWVQVCAKTNKSTSTLFNWRMGKIMVPSHCWNALARAFGIEPEQFDRKRYLREFNAANPPQNRPEELAPAPAPAEKPKGWLEGLFADEEAEA